MGKDKNALCSLRIRVHINNLRRCLEENIKQPCLYISVRDNCVGQNKSNDTLLFDCWLSMWLYKQVMIIYFIPGHSHIITNCVVTWLKGALHGKNIFNPTDLVNEINKVKLIKENWISHSMPNFPCFKD